MQRAPDGRAGFTGGSGREGMAQLLAPGEEFTTPRQAGLFTDGRFGATSRAWHAYVLAHELPHRAVHSAAVLSDYGLRPELPQGDWASATGCIWCEFPDEASAHLDV
ncbi:hypothetical protein ACWGII_27915 [Streptomyces sp. NPDC054855]